MDFMGHSADNGDTVAVTIALFLACDVGDGNRIHVAGFDLLVDLPPFESVADFHVGDKALVRDFGVADAA